MSKKTLISSAIISALLLSLTTVQAAESVHKANSTQMSDMQGMGETKGAMMDEGNMKDSASMSHAAMQISGEIIGDFNSPDGEVVGATLPGKEVQFSVPMNSKEGQYLHFALMHAESAKEGWYFAPASDKGIDLSALTFKDNKPVDITQHIALFQASNANQSIKVTADKGALKYGASNKFLQVTITPKESNYSVTIKNISKGDYQTPVSSGVWSVSNKAEKNFDHTPSAALSALATSGHRDALFQSVKMKSDK